MTRHWVLVTRDEDYIARFGDDPDDPATRSRHGERAANVSRRRTPRGQAHQSVPRRDGEAMTGDDPHHYPCPHCGERLAIGADRCHGCWKRVS